MALQRGKIVWVVVGPRGQYKRRPAVVVSDADSDGAFFVACGSTQFSEPLNAHEISLPFRDPSCPPFRSHPLTRLKKATVVDCRWIERLTDKDVADEGGRVPDTILVAILESVQPHLPAKPEAPGA